MNVLDFDEGCRDTIVFLGNDTNTQVVGSIFIDKEFNGVFLLDGFEHPMEMIEVNSHINLLGIELVHLEVVGIEVQVNENASMMIHHSKGDASII